MNAGSLNKRLRIQKPVETPDGIGGRVIDAWEDFGGAIWGSVKTPKMQTAAEGGDIISVLTRDIEIRYLPGVHINWRARVLDDGKVYKIIHVYNIGRTKTVLVCVEWDR